MFSHSDLNRDLKSSCNLRRIPAHNLLTRSAGLALLVAFVAACTPKDPNATIHDPFEERNREVHESNKGLDQAVYQPVARAYGNVVTPTADGYVSNFAENLSLPGDAANSLLQGDLKHTATSTARFVVNSTIGVLGIFDPATKMNIPERDTDFGETLHVWGVGPGAYIELPFLGPSTERDAIGFVVDSVANPMNAILPDGSGPITFTAYVLDKIGDRNEYGYLIDGLLYESEDSYAASRSLYLENRRRTLNDGVQDEDLEDPYADF